MDMRIFPGHVLLHFRKKGHQTILDTIANCVGQATHLLLQLLMASSRFAQFHFSSGLSLSKFPNKGVGLFQVDIGITHVNSREHLSGFH
jgi:hypothetical protein